MDVIKKLIAYIILLLLSYSVTGQGNSVFVYISTGQGAYAYHKKKECSRLKRCLEEGHVKMITLQEALRKGRRACKVCTKY